MTKLNQTHRLAGTAIAAFLALSSTSVWAQEAPADAAVAAPVAQPAPTLVLPSVIEQNAPAPIVAVAPVAVQAPTPRAVSSKAAAPRTAPAPKLITAPSTRTAAAAATPIAAAQTVATAQAGRAQPVAAANALPADLASPAVTTTQPASNGVPNELLLAGLAGALGLGAIGVFAATRRRRPIASEDNAVIYEPESQPAAIVPQRNATLVSPAFTPLPAWNEPRAPLAQASDSRALNLNRSALIDRMVAAEPDTNNPFTSGKARRRRARLMLQSMESNRWDDADLVPGFDWREMAQATQQRETVEA